MRSRLGQILHAVDITLQIEHLLLRPLAKVQVPIMVYSLTALVEDHRLSRTTITVQVAGLRVTAWPAVSLKVMQINLVVLNDAADRIAPVVRPSNVVPLLADEHMVAAGDYSA